MKLGFHETNVLISNIKKAQMREPTIKAAWVSRLFLSWNCFISSLRRKYENYSHMHKRWFISNYFQNVLLYLAGCILISSDFKICDNIFVWFYRQLHPKTYTSVNLYKLSYMSKTAMLCDYRQIIRTYSSVNLQAEWHTYTYTSVSMKAKIHNQT